MKKQQENITSARITSQIPVAADEHRASAKKNSNTSTEELPKGKLGLFSAKHSKEIYLVYGMSILMDREI